jgi:hypothetical protein
MEWVTYVTADNGDTAIVKGNEAAVAAIEEALQAQGYQWDDTVKCWHSGFYGERETPCVS